MFLENRIRILCVLCLSLFLTLFCVLDSLKIKVSDLLSMADVSGIVFYNLDLS